MLYSSSEKGTESHFPIIDTLETSSLVSTLLCNLCVCPRARFVTLSRERAHYQSDGNKAYKKEISVITEPRARAASRGREELLEILLARSIRKSME